MSKFNICIVRPDGYMHSSAFIELAELICYSLLDNGMSAEIKENTISSSSVNIILGCHLLDLSMIDDIPKSSIIFNTEQFGQGPIEWQQKIRIFLESFSSWDYSSYNISLIKSSGIKPPIHFKIGFHEKLKRIPGDIKRKIDVLFYGVLTDARFEILSQLEKKGIKVKKLVGVYGHERDFLISRSNIILNLHAHPTKIFEIIRVHYLMNNAKAVLSQIDRDTKIDKEYLHGIAFAEYGSLVERCVEILHSKTAILDLEERSLYALKKIDSRIVMSEMVDNLLSK